MRRAYQHHDVDEKVRIARHSIDDRPRLVLCQPTLGIQLHHLLDLTLWEIVELPGLTLPLPVEVGRVGNVLQGLDTGRVGRTAHEQRHAQPRRLAARPASGVPEREAC